MTTFIPSKLSRDYSPPFASTILLSFYSLGFNPLKKNFHVEKYVYCLCIGFEGKRKKNSPMK